MLLLTLSNDSQCYIQKVMNYKDIFCPSLIAFECWSNYKLSTCISFVPVSKYTKKWNKQIFAYTIPC